MTRRTARGIAAPFLAFCFFMWRALTNALQGQRANARLSCAKDVLSLALMPKTGHQTNALPLKHPDFGQRAVQLDWQGLFAFATLGQVGRRVFGFQVSPTLKRAFECGLNAHQLGVRHNGTAADTVRPDVFIQPQNPLTTGQYPLDHPINRPARENFGLAFGPHTGDVARATIGRLGAFCRLPCRKVIDGFRAHRKLDQVDIVIHRVVPSRQMPVNIL